MHTVSWAEYRLSRLMLGTVQFGMPYGVANRTGQPTFEDIVAMVAAAIDGGVNGFDTAAAYGDSEALLGRALRQLGVTERVVVVTKVLPLTPDDVEDGARAAQAIERSVAASRRRLGMDCLPVVLFHREADARYLEVLERLRDRGWLRHAGVSCDNHPGATETLVAHSGVAALQLPANILDRRHVRSGVVQQAAQHDVAVFIRSVYLQGLLLMPEGAIPEPLQAVLPVRRQFAAIAGDAGLTLSALAVRYMLGMPGVTSVLAGVETLAQVRENIALFAAGPLPADVHAAVNAVHPDLPEMVITPSMWGKPQPEQR